MSAHFRSHTCGELSVSHVGMRVKLAGWMMKKRVMGGGMIFFPLRDQYGIMQILVKPESPAKISLSNHETKLKKSMITSVSQIPRESVICVDGIVQNRPQQDINTSMNTGNVEVVAEKIEILNSCPEKIPFTPETYNDEITEETRLKYRYLDLRRDFMSNNLKRRANTISCARNYLEKNGFMEVETPILFKSTPEGAREFLVPSRLLKGQFYALPQSPQQYKQLLMASGVDRYFQVARCFRDEDLRSDRQPEFTQLDIEAAFTRAHDVKKLIESLIRKIWLDVLSIELPKSFSRMSYAEAMSKYGSDKPDCRYGYDIEECGEISENGSIKDVYKWEYLHIPNGAKLLGSTGIKTVKKMADELQKEHECATHIIKVKSAAELETKVSSQVLNSLRKRRITTPIAEGDILLVRKRNSRFVGGWTKLGKLRAKIIEILNKKGHVKPKKDWEFLWIEEFPLFQPVSEVEKQEMDYYRELNCTHHPFTAPLESDIPLLETSPLDVRGQHYDLVLNGNEIGGGSVRIHSAQLQRFILSSILRLKERDIHQFDHLITALNVGCPPHAGIALGLDRLIAIMSGLTSIRDVIAFPKNSSGADPTVGCPSPR